MAATPTRAEAFPPLDDELHFPRLSDAKREKLARLGARQHFEAGELVFAQGQREAPFCVIERGVVDFFDHLPTGDMWVSRADAGTFIGDIAVFTGEPTVVSCVAAEPCELIVFERTELRRMLAQWPELSELVLRTLSARRAWMVEHGHGVLRLFARRDSRRAFEVRDLLERNLLPVRWYDTDTDPEAGATLATLGLTTADAPVLVRHDALLRNPSAAQVARQLGLRAEVDGQRFDLVVLGAGPAGLGAAVYGGSEGLRTLVVEAWAPGGQAGTSTRIENYLGYPNGISGEDLTRKATLQAQRFDAVLSSHHRAVELADGPEGLTRVDLEDGQHVLARALVVATGARWRRLDVPGALRLTGAGVYHAATATDSRRCEGEDVVVVGGGNSAGQAAVHLARHARSVRVVVRRDGLSSTMSHYLVDRVDRHPRIEVVPSTEVTEVHGEAEVEAVTLRERREGTERRVEARAVFVMIGADPCTEAVGGVLACDEGGYVLCGDGARGCEEIGLRWPLGHREPFLLESTRPGVFAAGDVRAGAAKRVAGAVGDGAMAVRLAHQVLDGA